MMPTASARQFRRFAVQWLALIWLVGLILAALWPLVWLSQGKAGSINLTQLNEPPSVQHWFGTDAFGRDVLADLLAGTRNLLMVSLPAAVIATLLGGSLGAAAGYWGNQGVGIRWTAAIAVAVGSLGALLTEPHLLLWWLLGTALSVAAAYLLPLPATLPLPLDRLVLATAAFTASVPRLVLALLLAALHESSRSWLLAVLAGTCWPTTARLARTLVSQLRRQSYIEASYAAGFSAGRILWYHVLPNAWPGLQASLPLTLTVCLGLQTTLSFLGVGLPPDQPDWGRTLANARLEPSAWWVTAGTLFFLVCTMAALHQLLPVQLRRKLYDQRSNNPAYSVTNRA